MSLQTFGDKFDKNRIFALADNFMNIAAGVVVQNNFGRNFRMGLHKGMSAGASFFLIGRKDNPEIKIQIVLKDMFH